MFWKIRRDPTLRMRATRLYLVTVLICVLMLFSFNVISLYEQNYSGKGLSQEIGEWSALDVSAKRQVYLTIFAIIMFLWIFGIVLFLLIRVSGDIRWFQQRADFVSGVSHEFKTPLSLIRLYSETLASDDNDFAPEERKNYIRIITRESERMSRLIDNVLDFTKIERGRVRHELQEGDLAAAVSRIVADYSEYLEWKGFSVKMSIWPNLPLVRFNVEQISQALLNLLDNARKYSGKSRLIRVNLWALGNDVVVEVQDKGLGISVEEQTRIFEPFYRASKGSEKGGCGLGLYLVSEVMKEHGGRIELESEVDNGSSFRLFFPVSRTQQEKARKQKRPLLNIVNTGREA